jgi:TRAP-type C4-dicarboxylate transport system permease large subunit
MPLVVSLLGALLLVTYWPGLSLWLPTLVMGP